MRRAVVNTIRLFRILRVLGRHDVLPQGADQPWFVEAVILLLRNRNNSNRFGHRLAAALQELGPSFIKFGQSLAVRSDLIGEQAADDLSLLQDKMPAFDGDQATTTIESELGRKINEIFIHFDPEPIAAASIAQVHLAETAEGAAVAVKVLRPDIEAAFAKDLDLFVWLADAVELLMPGFARFKPRAVVAQFADVVRTELDLRLEAAAASELATACDGDERFRVPNVDWTRTGQRVLTLERVEGIRIDDVEKIDAAGLDRREILKNSAGAFFQQVFRDGFFHADMHPGNMFVTADGVLVPVDFGIMGRLDKATRYYLADMLMAFLQRDYKKVADIHFDAGLVPASQSRDAFALTLRSVAEPIFDRPLHQVSIAQLLAQLFQTAEYFQMEVQPQLLLLQKTMLVAEGVGRKLDPESNMWLLARPLIEAWMRRYRGPEARIQEGIESFAALVRRLPCLAAQAEELLQHLAERNRKAKEPRRFWRSVFEGAPGNRLTKTGTIVGLSIIAGVLLGYCLS